MATSTRSRTSTWRFPLQQITAIIGPSGCGKSTLLKSLNRLLELNEQVRVEGEVLLDGENIYDQAADVTEVRTRIGLLAQKPFPLPMSIYDNVAYGPRIHGLARGELDGNVREHLEAVGLWDEVGDRLKAPATGLSVGQQQRLCLARALAVEPEILLCDESTASLDPISARGHRGSAAQPQGPLYDRGRHAQHRPGAPAGRLRGLHVAGRVGRTRAGQQGLPAAAA